MTTLDDFYGDGSASPTPECSLELEEKSICYTCRAEIIGNVIEVPVSPLETHFHCEGCFTQLQNAKLSPGKGMEDSKGNWQPLFSEGFM